MSVTSGCTHIGYFPFWAAFLVSSFRLHLLIRYAMVIPTTTMPRAAETVMETRGSAPFIQLGNPAADLEGRRKCGKMEEERDSIDLEREEWNIYYSFH